ncbi:hypothetical protein BDP55DRAFT_675239, partial [Colletotrichum godetiae]
MQLRNDRVCFGSVPLNFMQRGRQVKDGNTSSVERRLTAFFSWIEQTSRVPIGRM